MPIYEFLCQTCGTEFEMVRSFSDSTTPACPKCAGANVQRQLSRPAIHFKGSGWYINDSKNGSKGSAQNTASTDDGESKSGDAKPEGEEVVEGKEKVAGEKASTEKSAKESVAKPAESTTSSKASSPTA